jgi:hypothetical protein
MKETLLQDRSRRVVAPREPGHISAMVMANSTAMATGKSLWARLPREIAGMLRARVEGRRAILGLQHLRLWVASEQKGGTQISRALWEQTPNYIRFQRQTCRLAE